MILLLLLYHLSKATLMLHWVIWRKKISQMYLQKAWWNNTPWEEDGSLGTPILKSSWQDVTDPTCKSMCCRGAILRKAGHDTVTREVVSVASLFGETQYSRIRLVYECALMLALILVSVAAWPRAASLVPGEGFLQGSSRYCRVLQCCGCSGKQSLHSQEGGVWGWLLKGYNFHWRGHLGSA